MEIPTDKSVVVDRRVRQAIEDRRLLKLSLYGKVRILEPHDYGIRRGERQLLGYQIAGDSSSGGLPDWRWIRLAYAEDVEILEATFPGRRPVPTGEHATWDELFARVGEGR